jgi:hypothetical protein
MAYPKLKFLSGNKVMVGIGYGLFVWLIMNRVVLPLSNIPPMPFVLTKAILAASILVVAIGLPLSFFANSYYSKQENR